MNLPASQICYAISTQHTENFPRKFSLCCVIITHLFSVYMISGSKNGI